MLPPVLAGTQLCRNDPEGFGGKSCLMTCLLSLLVTRCFVTVAFSFVSPLLPAEVAKGSES